MLYGLLRGREPRAVCLQVLYNLCEWPSRKGSRLAVIGIANTLDLPERLMPRIASRLGSRRVVFQPYKREQLQAIISQRLVDAGVAEAFEDNAIKYAASKVGPRLQAIFLGQRSYLEPAVSMQQSRIQLYKRKQL